MEELEKKLELVIEQLKARFRIQCEKKVKNYPFLMGQGVWIDSDKLEMTDAAKEKYPLLSEMYDALQGAQPIQYFSKLWSPAVVDALSNSYPALVYGQITPAEACQALTDAAAKG